LPAPSRDRATRARPRLCGLLGARTAHTDLTATSRLTPSELSALCIQAAQEVTTWSRWTVMVRIEDIRTWQMSVGIWDSSGPPLLHATIAVAASQRGVTLRCEALRVAPREWRTGPVGAVEAYGAFLDRLETGLRLADPAAAIRAASRRA
jgi:hypothetical protein